MLQALQLFLTIIEVVLLLGGQWIVVASGSKHRHLHSRFHTGFQVDVLVKRHVRPVIHHLYDGVARADAVDSPETLDDAHGIPVNVEVYQIVAVLQVLPLADAVGGNEHVNLSVGVWKDGGFLLTDRREKSEYGVEIEFLPCLQLQRGACLHVASYKGGV